MTPMQQAIIRVSRLTKRPKPHLMWCDDLHSWVAGGYAGPDSIGVIAIPLASYPYNTRHSNEAVLPLNRWSNFRECTGCMGHGIKYGVVE